VVCVDNGSADGSEAAIRAAFPEVAVVQTGANLGFAGGNNAGITYALEHGAQWVVLLNNDALLDAAAIEAFRAAAAAHPQAGALAGKLFFGDGQRIWFAGQDFHPAIGYGGRPHGYNQPDGPPFQRAREVGRAVGALMAVPRGVIEQVGLLDDALFLYVEDVDWCLRMRAAGYAIRLVPEATARHDVSASSGGERGSTAPMYYGVRNTIVVSERHAPLAAPLAWLRRGFVLATFAAQALLWSEDRPAGGRAVAAGFRDAVAGRLGPRR
jgi:GT2 family glycosyltransferase